MKNLLFLFSLLFSLSVCAQTTITLGPGNEGKTVTFWGTAADTITDTGSKSYVFTLNSPFTNDAYIQITGTKVTGYTKFKIAVTESLDNVTYYAITNIAVDTCKTGVTCSKFIKSAVLSAKITGKYLKVTATGIDSTQHETLKGVLRVVRKFDNL